MSNSRSGTRSPTSPSSKPRRLQPLLEEAVAKAQARRETLRLASPSSNSRPSSSSAQRCKSTGYITTNSNSSPCNDGVAKAMVGWRDRRPAPLPTHSVLPLVACRSDATTLPRSPLSPATPFSPAATFPSDAFSTQRSALASPLQPSSPVAPKQLAPLPSSASFFSPKPPRSFPSQPRRPVCKPADDEHENTPWAIYEAATLAEGVVCEQLEIASDGPPGQFKATLTSMGANPGRSRHSGLTAAPGQLPARGTVVCCTGCYECLEGPSCLFNKLASELPQVGIAVFQLNYRPPYDDDEEAVEDVMTSIDWSVKHHREPLVLVGWSMGAAVAIEAAYLRRTLGVVNGIATLAAQTAGAKNVKHLEMPILALHGEADTVLPTSCSKSLSLRAQQATLQLLPSSSHRMEEALPHVLEFVQRHLHAPPLSPSSPLSPFSAKRC